MNKKLAIFFTVNTLGLAALLIISQVSASFRFERDYSQFWELADKASTIPAKQKQIAAFVSALKSGKERGEFSTHNAIWLKTPNNSFDANLSALNTLAERLSQIQEMNPNTFEYNTAIQQITAQEQGEAAHLISVFRGCYELGSFPVIWDWVGVSLVFVALASAITSGVFWTKYFEWDF